MRYSFETNNCHNELVLEIYPAVLYPICYKNNIITTTCGKGMEYPMNWTSFAYMDKKQTKEKRFNAAILAGIIVAGLSLSACTTKQVFTNGSVIQADQVALVPVGSSKDQVLLALGTPSTTGTFDSEVFYYISQKREKTFEFQKAKIVSQRVFTVYFDAEELVSNVADYGLKDGKVFDFISRTTPTGGKDLTFLGRLLSPNKTLTPSLPGST